MSDTPSTTGWAVSSTGWINSEIWMDVLQWIVAYKKPTIEDPIAIITDCHSTRFNAEALQLAMTHHCHIIALPPNSTGILQPLDLAVFGPFKAALREAMLIACINGQHVDKVTVPRMICNAWEKAATSTNVKSGWRAAGMAVIDDGMGTHNIPSDHFRFIQLGGHNNPIVVDNDNHITTMSNEWVPPRDLQDILRMNVEERKTKPRRSKRVVEAVGYGLITTQSTIDTIHQWNIERKETKTKKPTKRKRKQSANATPIVDDDNKDGALDIPDSDDSNNAKAAAAVTQPIHKSSAMIVAAAAAAARAAALAAYEQQQQQDAYNASVVRIVKKARAASRKQ
jgi:hypothetical protein